MKVSLVQIFIASPSDTKEERECVQSVINELNQTIGSPNNLRFEALTWENNTYPDLGEDAQDVINKQIGDTYQIFLGIMWKKFGSPTKRAQSATEEEFRRAYDRSDKDKSYVKLMFYFNAASIPQDADLAQFSKVKAFKKDINKKGIYYGEYDCIKDFEKKVRIGLTRCITENFIIIPTNQIKDNKESESESEIISLTDDILNYINDIGVSFSHPYKDSLTFDDIYISPYLNQTRTSKVVYSQQRLDSLTNAINDKGIKYLILGNEVSGKTTACKFMFKHFFELNLCPVLLNGEDLNNNIRTERIIKVIEKKINEQYKSGLKITRDDNKNPTILLIIDDFQKSVKGNEKYWKALITNLESLFENIIVTGDITLSTNNLQANPPFKNFDEYSILEFGPTLRNELVSKWYTLGKDECLIDSNVLRRKIDEVTENINTILGKNYMPSFPLYILGILQALEVANTKDPNYSIHGFYYEMLINDSFARGVKDRKEISFFYNYLTYLCYYFFEEEITSMNLKEFEDFHYAYCNKHDVKYNLEKVIETFRNAKLLHFNHNVKMANDYIYYFFVAKYISNHIEEKKIKETVTKLSLRIFREEYASIIMFVTHLSKDKWVIGELIKNANLIFDSHIPAKLESDIDEVNNLILTLPKQVIELVDVNKQRNAELELKEEIERREKEFELDGINYSNFKLEDDVTSIDILAKMNLALKTIDILGQITKKHWGELDGETKYLLSETTYNLGLRSLSMYLNLITNGKDDIAEHIKNIIVEKHIQDKIKESNATFYKQEVVNETSKLIINLSFLSSWGVIKRISRSIGYDRLEITFDKILTANPYNSIKLIDLSIKLNTKGIPMKDVEEYSNEMKPNKMCFLMLQHLIMDHMYMFDVDYKQRNQICSKLEISIQTQRAIEGTSKIKRE